MCQDGGGRRWGRAGRRRPRPLLRGRGRRGLPGTAGRARRVGLGSQVGCASSAGLEVRAPVSPVPTPPCLSEGLGAVAAPGAGGSRSPGLGPRPGWGGQWCRKEGRRRCRSRGPRCPGLSPQDLRSSGRFRVGPRDWDAPRGSEGFSVGCGGEKVQTDAGYRVSPPTAPGPGQGCVCGSQVPQVGATGADSGVRLPESLGTAGLENRQPGSCQNKRERFVLLLRF